jgi:outer membrane protein assembly factor BamA
MLWSVRAVLFCVGASLLLSLLTQVAEAQLKVTVFDSLAISSVEFTGNSAISDQEFILRIQTQETPGAIASWLYRAFGDRFPFAKEPRYFDEPLFQDDLDVIRQFYKNNGYFEARVDGDYAVDNKSVKVSIRIHEGRESRIDSVAYRNLHRLPEQVQALIARGPLLRVGQPYRADDVEAERQRILGIMADNGFPRGTSDSVRVERKLSNNNVIVKLSFNHGRRLYFGDVTEIIRGDDDLNLARRIIYDRLDFESGEIYSRSRQINGEINLNRLDVFSSVQISPMFPPIVAENDSLVPITLELTPRQRFELAPAYVLNNQMRGLTTGGEISFSMRNAFGGAQTVSTKFNLLGRLPNFTGTYQAGLQLLLDQPYLFSNTNSGFVSGAYTLVAEQDLAEGAILQIAVGAKRFFSTRLVGQASWTYEISEFSGDAKALLGSRLIAIDTTETINFRNSIRAVNVEHDLTDDLFNPGSGTAYKFLAEEAGFLEGIGVSPLPQGNEEKGIRSTEYVKLEGTAKYFSDLSSNRTTIFGWRARVGGIFRYGQSKEDNLPVPPNRRYYAGGASSVRGWTARELAADTAIAFFGSNALVEISAEVRWHLFPKARNWLDGLWFVGFVDAGNLWEEFGDISVEQTALAMGFGVRYNLFFGPIRVDFGLKAYNPTSEHHRWFFEKRLWSEVIRKGVFQFSIGHAF